MWCLDTFSPEARRVMRLAHAECDRLGHPYFGGEHLLLGLLAAGTGPAARRLTGRGIALESARAEVNRIVTAGAPAGRLREWGIDLDEVRRRLEADFGAEAVAEAARRVARRPWWNGRRQPVPLYRKPFLNKRASELAARRARQQDGTVTTEHLLYGVLRDARDPLRAGLKRRATGLAPGGSHPVRLLLAAYGIDPEELL